jgi:hypothetical protein
MGPEQIELSAKERERLKVLHEVEQGHQRAPAAGAHPTPGGNSQRAPDAHGGGRSHGQLARPALGAVARRCLRRITRGARGDRTVSGRFALVALPRLLPAAACLPRRRHHRQLLAARGQEESPMPKSKHPRRSKPIASAPDHPWRKPWKRTFLSGRKPDISTLR